jgi:HEAT repeat protein
MRGSRKDRSVANIGFTIVLLFVCSYSAVLNAVTDDQVKEFIGRIRNDNADVRYAAWHTAGPMGSAVVAPLAALLGGEDKGVAKAASEALNTITHYACRPGSRAERRAVSKELVRLLESEPHAARVKALELLALCGQGGCVPFVAPLMKNEKLREDARRALERIPGDEATQALIEALKEAPEAFRPAIIHSLARRNAGQALGVLVECAQTSDKAIVLAALDALSRIDGTPDRSPQTSLDWSDLSEREKASVGNMFVRLADKMAADGRIEMAVSLYRRGASNAEDGHFRCAGMIGLARIGSADDVPGMVRSLSDASAAVRSVAEEALVALKGNDVDAALEKANREASEEIRAVISRIMATRRTE